MTKTWKTLALSLVLAAPMVLGQIAVAQTLPQGSSNISQCPIMVAQNQDQKELDAFFDSGYSYWDAKVLAGFWGGDVIDAKARVGAKLLGPYESKLYLQAVLTDARAKAICSAENLNCYAVSGFSYDDAASLAKFWGYESPYEGKLSIERNLILGNENLIREMLETVR